MMPELNKIYQGDCLEIMRTWPDKCVDLVITDPPYGEKTHNGARTGKFNDPVKNDPVKLVDFNSVDSEYMISLAKKLCELAKRWVVMTCDWRHCAAIEAALPEIFIRAGVWTKPNPTPQFTGDRPSTGWEAVAILHRQGRKQWNGGGHAAVWHIPKISGEHPTEKPIALLLKWVRLFANEDDIILDPFCGSGTTLVAAEKNRHPWIGIEIEPKYVAIAQARVDAEMAQGKLF